MKVKLSQEDKENLQWILKGVVLGAFVTFLVLLILVANNVINIYPCPNLPQ